MSSLLSHSSSFASTPYEDLIASQSRKRDPRSRYILIGSLFSLDFLFSFLLYSGIHDFHYSSITDFHSFSSFLSSLLDFRSNTIDLFFLLLIRIIIFLLLLIAMNHIVSTKFEKNFNDQQEKRLEEEEEKEKKEKEKERKKKEQKKINQNNNKYSINNNNNNSLGEPLLTNDYSIEISISGEDGNELDQFNKKNNQKSISFTNGDNNDINTEEKKQSDNNNNNNDNNNQNNNNDNNNTIITTTTTNTNNSLSSTISIDTPYETEKIAQKLREAAIEKRYNDFIEARRNYINYYLIGLFIIISWHQVQYGVKLVGFHFNNNNDLRNGIWMTLLIGFIIAEGFSIKNLFELITKEDGILLKNIHSHTLYYGGTANAGHWCDICRARILKNGFRCTICDFDLCESCLKKRRKNANAMEGMLLRGDKGVRPEKEITTWQYIKRALGLVKGQLWLIIIAMACLLTTSAFSLLLPNFQGLILDDVIHNNNDAFSIHIKLFIIINIGTGIFGAIRSLSFSIVGSRLANDVRNKLFASLIIQDIAFYDSITTGELTSRLGTDVYAMVSPVQTVLTTFLSSFTLLIGASFMCVYTSWQLSILAVTSLTPIMEITRAYAKWSRQINHAIWAFLAEASSIATEAFSNIRIVRAHGAEEFEKKKYYQATFEALIRGIKDAWAGGGTFFLTNMVELATGVLLLWYGGRLVMNNDGLSIGKLITFQLYWNLINNNFQNLVSVLNAFTRAAGAASRVLSLMDNHPDIHPNEGLVPEKSQYEGNIKINNISFSYQMRPDKKVLDDINLDIPAGSVCALVGRSGAGKSSIVHLLMRYYDVHSGNILIDDIPLTSLQPIHYRQSIGLVAQDSTLFVGTIEENIAYGLDKSQYKKEDIIAASMAANCHSFIMEMEEGYQSKVGERGVRLSGGQRQRIAIARAILRKPTFLLLDEATSALDAESEALVQEAIDRLLSAKKCTVILVAHRLSTVMNADIICVVDKGHIVEKGTHQQLLDQNGIYSKLVKRQLQLKANELQNEKVGIEEGDSNSNNSSSNNSITNNKINSPHNRTTNKGKDDAIPASDVIDNLFDDDPNSTNSNNSNNSADNDSRKDKKNSSKKGKGGHHHQS